MILDPDVKLGFFASPHSWEPMSYSSYSACVHAWRCIDPAWEDRFAVISYALALDRKLVFG